MAAIVLAVGLVGLLGLRLAVLTPPGRAAIEALANSQSAGPLGRVRVQGLHGDPFSDFTLDHLSLADARGPWLDARGLRVRWSPLALIANRLQLNQVQVADLKVLRRPDLAARPPAAGASPLSIRIGRLDARLELAPAFARQYGDWTVGGRLDWPARGDRSGDFQAKSRIRPGDGLALAFALARTGALSLDLTAHEAQGGSIAGALGYSPAQPFAAEAYARGQGGQGAFQASATSGALTPLKASGRWTPVGGSAEAVLAFKGSDLLEPLARRLGDQATARVAVSRQADGRLDLDAKVQADTLTLAVSGLLDSPAASSKSGLKFNLASASADRLAGRGAGGAARFDGVWRGTLGDWRIDGALDLKAPGVDDYRLVQVAGPLTARLYGGRLDASADLQGAGGQGPGLLAALLGQRPRLRLELARTADGRLLAQRIDLAGADLAINGQGGAGLTGAFSIKGRAEIARLSALHPGGRGGLVVDWRAAEGRPGAPWTIGLKADGRSFATGVDQLDRLLGEAPSLRAEGRYGKGVLILETAALTGKAASAKGRGTLHLAGPLDLAAVWSAHGPFDAGPLTLAGDAKGSAQLGGTLLHPTARLNAHFDRVELPQLALNDASVALTFGGLDAGHGGTLAVHAASAYGPASATTRFALAKDSLALDQIALDAGGLKLKGALTLARGGLTDADLTFQAGPGAFLTAGALHGGLRLGRGGAASITAAGADLAVLGAPVVFKTLQLQGQGTDAQLPFDLSFAVQGQSPLDFSGSGALQRTPAGRTLTLKGSGAFGAQHWRTLVPATLDLTPQGRRLQADLGVGAGRLALNAQALGDGLQARASFQALDAGVLAPRIAGRLDGGFEINGKGSSLAGTLTAKVAGLKALDAPDAGSLDADIKAVLDPARLKLNAVVHDSSKGSGTVEVDAPVIASAAPLRLAVARTQPLTGSFSAIGELRPYWNLVMDGETAMSGQVSAQGAIGGTLDQPRLTGSATLENGRLTEARTGLDLKAMAAAVTFTPDAVRVDRFKAEDGRGGTVTGQGRLNLARGSASSFSLDLGRFQLLDRDQMSAKASGPITVTRAGDGRIKLAGALKVQRAVLAPRPPTPPGVVKMDVIEVHKRPGRGLAPKPRPMGPDVELDVSLKAPGQVLLQGRGLNAELALNAHVGGTTRAPELTGSATLIRGDYSFAGKRFVFDPNSTINLNSDVGAIRLNLDATYNPPSSAVSASVHVGGTAAKPQITLSSTPNLPQDEILSQILFGGSASQLSTAQAAQIGAATASLASGGGFDVLSNLKEFAGLDVLAFGADGANITVTGGKYVGSNLYLEVVGGGQGGTSVQADWRATKNLSIVSQVAGQGYSKLSIFWRKDFH